MKTYETRKTNIYMSLIKTKLKTPTPSLNPPPPSTHPLNPPPQKNDKNDKNEIEMEDNYQKLLIEKMDKQIVFLQNELANKNEIINTQINDKSVSNVNHQPKDESTIVSVKTENLESNPSMEVIINEMKEQNVNSASVKMNKKSRSITILGDSILKDIKPYKIRNG